MKQKRYYFCVVLITLILAAVSFWTQDESVLIEGGKVDRKSVV